MESQIAFFFILLDIKTIFSNILEQNHNVLSNVAKVGLKGYYYIVFKCI